MRLSFLRIAARIRVPTTGIATLYLEKTGSYALVLLSW